MIALSCVTLEMGWAQGKKSLGISVVQRPTKKLLSHFALKILRISDSRKPS
ncbi:MAG: hypothetical protein ACI9DF_000270 [Verrucomicrobiales bacterium]|jgi:hypothetical protein